MTGRPVGGERPNCTPFPLLLNLEPSCQQAARGGTFANRLRLPENPGSLPRKAVKYLVSGICRPRRCRALFAVNTSAGAWEYLSAAMEIAYDPLVVGVSIHQPARVRDLRESALPHANILQCKSAENPCGGPELARLSYVRAPCPSHRLPA